MEDTAPVPLIGPGSMLDLGICLPPTGSNLFGRVIRNPQAPGRSLRERACTEMLCGILQNCPDIRKALVAWFSQILGQDAAGLDEMAWTMDTEVYALGKRLDLCLEGRDAVTGEARVLWVIEAKVMAGLHGSADVRQEGGDAQDGSGSEIDSAPESDDEGEASPDTVNQLCNYDHWLRLQPFPCRGGIVIAPSDKSADLPSDLTQPWVCTTWMALGLLLRDQLQAESLGEADAFLARHMIGFVVTYLKGDTDMVDQRLGFDELALMKAATRLGNTCRKISERLAAVAGRVMEEEEIGIGKIDTVQMHLEATEPRASSWRYMLPDDDNVWLSAGIHGDNVAVWLESMPRWQGKSKLREAVVARIRDMPSMEGRWVSWHDDESWVYWDLAYFAPLELLLVAGNQDERFAAIIRDALRALKSSGLLEDITVAGR